MLKSMGTAFSFVGLALSTSAITHAADPDTATRATAFQLMGQALQAEMDGDLLARERLLSEAEQVDARFAAPLWYQGLISGTDGCHSVQDAIELARDNSVLAEYEQERSQHLNTVSDHWTMAMWCAQHRLGEQCRAHLLNILLQDPDHMPARRTLGHQLVDNEWVTPADRRLLAHQAERTRAGFSKYQQDINKHLQTVLRATGEHRRPAREAAWQQLRSIKDPLAVPVMNAAAEEYGEPTARLVVEWLGGIADQEAALSLARFALIHPSPEVQELAIAQLKNKSFYDFMPELLDAMSSPITFVTVPVLDPIGRCRGYRQAFAKEQMNEKRLWNFDTSVEMLEIFGDGPRINRGTFERVISLQPLGYDAEVGRRATLKTAARHEFQRTTWNTMAEENAYNKAATQMAAYASVRVREATAQRENQFIQDSNARVAELISRVADVEFRFVPGDVWNWWDNYNETDYQRSKLSRRRYNNARFVFREALDLRTNYSSREVSREQSITYGSCFVAGTMVTTLRGQKPIETIVAGDMVLSRSVLTGELRFKPVVAATTRTPAQSVILHVNNERLHATTSHLLWVSGKGWTKAGDIESGALLHSATEPAVVMRKRPGPVVPTHNLIVADYHTYFVGDSQVLSHDVLPRSSVHELVPGQFCYEHPPVH